MKEEISTIQKFIYEIESGNFTYDELEEIINACIKAQNDK